MKKLVIVESNASFLHLIPAARSMGWTPIFVGNPMNASWYNHDREQLLKGVKQIYVKNSSDATELLSVLKNEGPVDLVLTCMELCLEAVAKVAEALSLPFSSADFIRLAQDKYLTRQRFAKWDSHCSVVLKKDTDIEAVIANTPFPAFLKPRRGVASQGAQKIESAETLRQLWRTIVRAQNEHPNNPSPAFLLGDFVLEVYLEGRMMSAEVGVTPREHKIFMIDERRRSGEREQVEIGTMMPALISPDEQKEIEEFVFRIIKALEMNRGFLHLEFMLTSQGPRLIEVNPRLMGGSLPLLYKFSTGNDIFKSLLESYSQDQLSSPHSFTGFAMSRIFGARHAGILSDTWSLLNIEDLKSEFQAEIKLWKDPGQSVQKLESNFDYLGYFFIKAQDKHSADEKCEKLLCRLEELLGLEILR